MSRICAVCLAHKEKRSVRKQGGEMARCSICGVTRPCVEMAAIPLKKEPDRRPSPFISTEEKL